MLTKPAVEKALRQQTRPTRCVWPFRITTHSAATGRVPSSSVWAASKSLPHPTLPTRVRSATSPAAPPVSLAFIDPLPTRGQPIPRALLELQCTLLVLHQGADTIETAGGRAALRASYLYPWITSRSAGTAPTRGRTDALAPPRPGVDAQTR